MVNRKGGYHGLTLKLVERSEINSKIKKAQEVLRREMDLKSQSLQQQINDLKERDKERTDNLSVSIRFSISIILVLLVAIVGMLMKIVLSST